MVQQHPDEQGERVVAEQGVGGGVSGDVQGYGSSVAPRAGGHERKRLYSPRSAVHMEEEEGCGKDGGDAAGASRRLLAKQRKPRVRCRIHGPSNANGTTATPSERR